MRGTALRLFLSFNLLAVLGVILASCEYPTTPPGGGATVGGGWTDDGTVVRLTTITDRVGIGTANPTEKLHVVGNLKLESDLVCSGCVKGTAIADGSVTASKLAANSVNSSKVVDGSLGAQDVNTAEIQRRVSGNCSVGNAIRVINADGTVTCEPVGGGGPAWLLTGNAGTDPTTNFLGTTDNVALEIRANNFRALRIEPAATSNSSPNIIGGFRLNSVATGIQGATIAGGGASICVSPPCYNQVTDDWGTVSGGAANLASNIGATVCGGQDNTASGVDSTVAGGAENTAAGDWSFAAGRKANANHQGAFVWADSQNFSFSSTAVDEFSVRSTGGARFVSAVDGSGNPTAGVYLAPGANSWSAISDRELKENFTPVDGRLILERLSLIPITEWNMKSQDPSIRHIGPMAQDFYAAFGLGESERYINSSDADGIALVSIQALYQMSLEKEEQIARLSRELEELRASNAALQEEMGALLERLAELQRQVEALTRGR